MPGKKSFTKSTKMRPEVDHLHKVIEELEQAKKFLPQIKREGFVRQVVSTDLFKSLQQQFFKIIPQFGFDILNICNDAVEQNLLTTEQRNELGNIGNTISELSFKMLSGSIDVKEGFRAFVGALRGLHVFLRKNPSVAVKLGSKLLAKIGPLEKFVATAKQVVSEAKITEPVREGLTQRLNMIESHANQVKEAIESPILNTSVDNKALPPVLDFAKSFAFSPLGRKLQRNLLVAIFPISGTILNVAAELYNGGILNEKQRNELAGIGLEIMRIPFQLLSGKMDFNQALGALTHGLKSLANFFMKNPDIAVKAGVAILPALIPMGGFLKEAVSLISKSEFAQQAIGGLLKKNLGLLGRQFGRVENTFEKSALQVLEGPKK